MNVENQKIFIDSTKALVEIVIKIVISEFMKASPENKSRDNTGGTYRMDPNSKYSELLKGAVVIGNMIAEKYGNEVTGTLDSRLDWLVTNLEKGVGKEERDEREQYALLIAIIFNATAGGEILRG